MCVPGGSPSTADKFSSGKACVRQGAIISLVQGSADPGSGCPQQQIITGDAEQALRVRTSHAVLSPMSVIPFDPQTAGEVGGPVTPISRERNRRPVRKRPRGNGRDGS